MTELQLAVLFADLALIVVVARAIGRVAQAFGQPAVIGEIIGGILVGPTLAGGEIAHLLFPTDVRPYLSGLANLGLVLFMFMIGLEFDLPALRGAGRITAATVAGAALVPFALGLPLALYLAHGHHPGNRLSFTLFIGVAVSVTAFPVLARILADRGMTRTRLGTIALSAAAICDLAAWTMLAVVQAISGGGHQSHWRVLLVIPYAVVLVAIVRPIAGRLLTGRAPDLVIVLAGVFLSAAVTQWMGLHFVFGAFLFGLVLPRLDNGGLRDELLSRTRLATTLLLPVYFIVAGLNVDLSHVGRSGLLELVLIMVVAVTGKFGGVWLGARSQGLPPRQSAVLATLMNTRGLTELIALTVGLQIGVLDTKLYSLMVVMAVTTTAMTGPLLWWLSRPKDGGRPLPEPQRPSRRGATADLADVGVTPQRSGSSSA